MKKLFMLLMLFLTGCHFTTTEEWIQKHKEHNASEALVVMREMVYVKDNRTGLCFAYYWGNDEDGGPALTNVPCDKVEKFLVNNNQYQSKGE